DAALRVLALSPDPQRAALWWDAVERRVLSQRGFEWAHQVTSYLQGNDGAAKQSDVDECRLRPAILATYAATLLRTESRGVLPSVWAEVRDKASLHPEEKGRKKLELRAAAGLVSACRWTGEVPNPK